MLQILWNTLAYKGIFYARDYAEHKHIVLVNGLSILIAVFTFINFLTFLFFDMQVIFKFIVISYIFLVPLTVYFNAIGKLLFARIYVTVLSIAYISFLVILQGTETKAQLFLLAEGFVIFFIFPRQERNWKIGFAAFTFLAYSSLEIFYNHVQPIIPTDPSTIEARKTVMDILFGILLFTLAVYINSIFQKSELATQLEQEKSERLLLNILPASVIKKLRENSDSIAERFENCTVLFSDIVGFSELSRKMTADSIVKLLNNIFSSFDDLVEKYGLEKIKTIGDAYMVVGGLPEPDENHAEKVANFALDMLEVVKDYSKKNNVNLELRIGINSGNAVAGVIGKKKFIYDLWGDSVNTASRMESHGLPGKIQISNSTYFLIKDKFQFSDRGSVEVKGIGKIQSYLLLEKVGD